MITKDKVTEIFCIIDEFCKHFDAENAQKVLYHQRLPLDVGVQPQCRTARL